MQVKLSNLITTSGTHLITIKQHTNRRGKQRISDRDKILTIEGNILWLSLSKISTLIS